MYTNYSGFLRLYEECGWSIEKIADCLSAPTKPVTSQFIQEVFDELSMQPQGLRKVPVLDEHLTPEMKKGMEEARKEYGRPETSDDLPSVKTNTLSRKRLVRKLSKSGLTGKAIAERLGISQSLVSQTLSRKRKSLGRRKRLVRA